MVDTNSVRPTGLIRDLDITIGGHAFRISAVVLQLNMSGAYPLLLGRRWLKTTHIKQNWQKNVIPLKWGKSKVQVPTQERADTSKQLAALYLESINMLDGLTNDEIDQYLDEHPRIVDVVDAVTTYVTHREDEFNDPDREAIREL